MRRTNIYLDEEQTASLDRLAEQAGVSRAELIRQLLNRALTSGADDLTADLNAINESFGVLHDLDPPARRRGGREEHLAQMWRATS
ncbi:CopG family transcriptional regulator [Mycobacterium riyadhense]|uniref:Antitoxin n=1 Tax=Mycobacterium riyadhense TaxID=486698 RepID=A0A1X2BJT4_9MYCO|nr:CopG family transcriptional regulator [Mycobacterium riyadhense]MCV7149104.1 CopG family transcriptional regulator [Mycobacterium riyadhense]ORW63459.1 antitoxin [Mycobacterium riyadhense]VTP00651.1 Ribbon-helix-helix protein, copG family [Mycobacterium riyadhense]